MANKSWNQLKDEVFEWYSELLPLHNSKNWSVK